MGVCVRPAILVVAAFVVAASCKDSGPVGEPSAGPVDSTVVSTETSAATTVAPVSGPDEPAPSLVAGSCPSSYPVNAECSTLTVAADRADPDGGTIELPVVVLQATGPSPEPDAVVIPAGGPGYPGAGDLFWAGTVWNERRDIVLYDQRGTGEAVPSLECPAFDAAFVDALKAAGSSVDERDAMASARDRCIEGYENSGIDLSDYHSEASADDLDELREALGYEQWNLLGISYGGRLALATMRSHPEGVRAAILDSVYDVTYGGLASWLENADRAFRRLAEGCATDPACATTHGDLAAKIDQIRQMYNQTPVSVDVDVTPQAGEGSERFLITGDDIMLGLFYAQYDAGLIPQLPSIIEDLVAGDTWSLTMMVRRVVLSSTLLADAMALAVECADNVGLEVDDADAAVFEEPGGFGLLTAWVGLCPPGWPATPGDFNAPVVSNIPSLVLAGSYDPATPPAGSEGVAEGLATSTFVLVEPGGHWVTDFDPCITGIELAFLDDPAAEVDVSCATAIPPPAFR